MQSNVNYKIEIRTPARSVRKTIIPHKSLDVASTINEDKYNALNLGMYIRNVIDHHLSKYYESYLEINVFNENYENWLLKIANTSVDKKPYVASKDIYYKLGNENLSFQCIITKEKV